MPGRVLIAGVSARAAADSAVRAGFVVTVIDAFNDLDHPPAVRVLSPPEGFSTHAAALMAREVECDAVVYLAGFENHPEDVRMLTSGRALWGNPPSVLRTARDPVRVARALAASGRPTPRTFGAIETETGMHSTEGSASWLVKPIGAGGGHGVRPWRGQALPEGCYLQERVDGVSGAVVFAAAEGRACALGVSRQLIGDPAFGASGYRYCGSILAPAEDAQFTAGPELHRAACELAATAAEAFGLTGVNGVDFVAHNGSPYPVEVNPRWCASMELSELAYGRSIFETHALACSRGELPAFDLLAAPVDGAVGKAVVFARSDLIVGDFRSWLREEADFQVRDVPRPGQHIRAGRPVCTVYASGPDGVACYRALVLEAEQVYGAIARWG